MASSHSSIYTINLSSNIICQRAGLLLQVEFAFIPEEGESGALLCTFKWEEHFRAISHDGNPYVVSKVSAGPLCLRFHSEYIGRVLSHSSSLIVHLPVNQANSIFCILSPGLKFYFFSVSYHFKTAQETVVSHSEIF